MANTPNYNLKKVEYTEIADIPGHFNANFDTIDTVMKNNADAAVAAEDNAKNYASGLIGTLSNLLTTAKNNIVAAVNEIFGKVEDVEDELIAHQAENVTNEGGAHGIEYEEGEWIPQFSTPDYTGGNEYIVQSGKYIRINNKVTLYGRMTLSKKAESLTGACRIVGLPFIPSGSTSNALIISNINKLNIPLGTSIGGYRVNDYILLLQFNGTTVSNIKGQDLTDNTDISFVFEHYI